jgi:hypothetical protein
MDELEDPKLGYLLGTVLLSIQRDDNLDPKVAKNIIGCIIEICKRVDFGEITKLRRSTKIWELMARLHAWLIDGNAVTFDNDEDAKSIYDYLIKTSKTHLECEITPLIPYVEHQNDERRILKIIK